jgi:hypothetical protein
LVRPSVRNGFQLPGKSNTPVIIMAKKKEDKKEKAKEKMKEKPKEKK